MCSTHSHKHELTGNEFIKELIKCAICLDTFTDPRMLPCQHSFCLSCLEHLADNDGRWGRCPQCRQLFRIPFNGVSSFDVNRTIAQLLDTFPKQQNEKPALVAKCSGCRKEDLITTCDHCKEALCKPCRTEHFHEMKSSITDQVAKISTESEKFMDREVEFIKKHEANLNVCKEIRQSIQSKANEIISRIKNEEAKLLDDVDEFERIETDFLGDKQERLTNLEAMNDFSFSSNKILSVKSETDKEVMEISERCVKFIDSLGSFTSTLNLRYTSRHINFISMQPGINPENIYSIGYVETVTEEDDTGNKTMEVVAEPVGKSMDKSEELLSDFQGNELPSDEKYETLEMHVKPPVRTRSKSSSFLCKRPKSHGNVDKVNKSSSKNKNKSIVDPRKFFQGYKIIGGEGEDSSEFKHPLGIAVSPINGHIYVADSWNNRIQVFDEFGVFTNSIEKVDQVDLHYPYSIHIDKKGRIYVSDQSLARIKVLDSHFNLIRTIGSYGRGIGCYSGLCDIGTDENDNIYVCDSGNHRILKFSESGDFISQWGSNGSEEGQFKCPACVTVHGERVIVSDWGNNRVQIFTLNGDYLSQLGKQGSGPSEFQRPLGVAIDEKGNIAIVDEGNNRIQIFKSDFSYHSKITGLKCDFQRPW